MPLAQDDPLSGTITRTPDAAPLQGQTVPYATGVLGSFTAAAASSMGASLAARAWPGGADNQFVNREDAAKQMKDEGLDPSVLPKDGIYQSGLDAIKEQQTIVNNAQDAAQRSNVGGVVQFAAGLAGGFTDPLFLGLGPLGRVASEAKVGLAGRAAIGAAEGGTVMGGYTEAEKQFGTAPGDRDITSYEVLRQTGFGMVFGGAANAAFGARPLTTDKVAMLERSAAAAKKADISVNDVVSPAGAIGVHQIMPDTARMVMGKDFDVKTLHDPVVNKEVAQKILDHNDKLFPNDMEAQAIAYNAGPGRAQEWIKAGRNDAVLPAETQQYLSRLRADRDQNPLAEAAALPPEVKSAALTTAVAQTAADSVVNVDPILKSGEGWRSIGPEGKDVTYNRPPPEPGVPSEPLPTSGDGWRSISPEGKDVTYNPPPPLADAVPKPGSATINERLSMDMLERINAAPEAKPPVVAGEEDPDMAEIKAHVLSATQEAEHAEQMAHGIPAEGEAEHTGLKTALDETKEDSQREGELHKAIEAAVNCSMLRGTE